MVGEIDEIQFLKEIKVEPKKSYRKIFFEEYKRNVRIKKSMIEILKLLKSKGYTLVLLSNLIKPQALYLRKKLSKYFSLLLFSCEMGIQKPDKRIYLEVLKRLNVKGEECVFVDNKEENLKVAELCGMKTILFRNVKQFRKELKELGIV